jgi:peroxiredoxin
LPKESKACDAASILAGYHKDNTLDLGTKILIATAVIAVATGLLFLNRHRTVPGGSVTDIAKHPLAPEFSLPELTGQTLDLSAYRGKVVLLDFWATWCDPCREEIPHFVELQTKYRDQGLQVIGISMDDGPEPVRDFYQRFHMNYPVAMGNAKTGELYGGVLGLPIAFLIDRNGRIEAKHIGATNLSFLEREIKALLQLSINIPNRSARATLSFALSLSSPSAPFHSAPSRPFAA